MSTENETEGTQPQPCGEPEAFTGYISGGLPAGTADYGFRTVWSSPDEAPEPVLVIPLFGTGYEGALLAGADALDEHGTDHEPGVIVDLVVRAIAKAADVRRAA